MPDHLKAGIENLSGIAMDDVSVHYNSSKPAQLQALAYTSGTEIHVAPGQEQHLSHEAWHVVQQKEGRVKPTLQYKAWQVNDDEALEKEADIMGAKATQAKFSSAKKLNSKKIVNAVQQKHTVQRKIGFEFEDQNWRAWKKPLVGSIRPAKRKEVLHKGTGFKLEGDDTPGPLASNIEFVTDPFDISFGGVQNLNTAMQQIRTITTRIGGYAGRDDTAGNYLQSNEHQLSESRVLLSQGNANGAFKMQATHGISLEDMPTIMKYIGSGVPAETPLEAGQRLPARMMMSGRAQGQGSITNVIGNAPALADVAINHLRLNGLGLTAFQRSAFAPPNTNDAVRGFLAQVILYVKMFSITNNSYLKYKIPLLARTDFAALFQQLPLNQQASLRENNAQAFSDAVVTAVNSNQLIPIPAVAGGGFFDINFNVNGPLICNTRPNIEPLQDPANVVYKYPVFRSLTISDWLDGITQGKDYLTAKEMNNWLKANEPNLSKSDRKRHVGYLESFASLGNKTDNPDRLGASRLGIYENRAIAPTHNPLTPGGNLTALQAHKAALNYLFFLMQIKAGQPGTYPNLNPA